MQKLEQKQEGKYFLNGIEVTPILVYGPILYTHQQVIDITEIPINTLIQQIKSETDINLEQIANSYTSGGITITESSEKRTRHEFICFFNSNPKPCN